jgi:hypothetical protein
MLVRLPGVHAGRCPGRPLGHAGQRVLPRRGVPVVSAQAEPRRSPTVPFHPRDKVPAVIRYAGPRPLTWIDDALPPEAHAWAARRRIPTLLIGTDPAEGLTRPIIDQSLQWANNHLGQIISHRPDQLRKFKTQAFRGRRVSRALNVRHATAAALPETGLPSHDSSRRLARPARLVHRLGLVTGTATALFMHQACITSAWKAGRIPGGIQAWISPTRIAACRLISTMRNSRLKEWSRHDRNHPPGIPHSG